VIGLGEATHGTHEFFLMKHRLLEYLVKRLNFTIFAVEANMAEAKLLNDYIINGKGNKKELLNGLHFWTINTHEFLDLITWLHDYNKNAKVKVQFVGFDMQYINISADIIKSYLKYSGDSEEVVEVETIANKINSLDALKNKDLKAFANLVQQSPDNYLMLFEGIKNIQRHISSNPKNINSEEFNWVFQNSKILEQKTQSLIDTTARDKVMAENIKWILDNNPNAKIVVWSHNDHIKKYDSQYIPMGKHLSNMVGDDYKSIALSTSKGTYTAISRNKINETILRHDLIIPPMPKEKFVEYLDTFNEPILLVNVKEANQYKTQAFSIKPILFLDIGASELINPFVSQNVFKAFDGIIYISSTTASNAFALSG
jgi:erythromycin esterase